MASTFLGGGGGDASVVGAGGGGGGDASAANQTLQLTELQGINSKTPAPRTPTTTSVASSATSVTLLASNTNRRGVTIANDSTSVLRLSFSTPATAANAFVVVPADSFLVITQQLLVTSAIYGIWASANGTAQVTEYV